MRSKIVTRSLVTPIAVSSFREADGDGDGLTLVGLAVPFNQPTRIENAIEGRFDEQFAPGAFKRTLSHKTPLLQFDHGTHPTVGSIPIGRFERLVEARDGLRVRARLYGNWLTEPVRDAIAGGSIPGMSIRFRPIQIDITDPQARAGGADVELRTITEAELIELGPVVFPAYPTTEVDVRHNEREHRARVARLHRYRAIARKI